MTEELDKQIEIFADGSVQKQHDTLTQLIKEQKLHAATKDKRFQSGIDSLLITAGDKSAPDLQRLLAVATLGRLASMIKKLQPVIYESLQEFFEEPLPDPSLLTEQDDRSYIGNACEQVQPDWGAEYCARAVIYEETGEQVRTVFLKALLSITPDLSAALKILADITGDFVPETKDTGVCVAKRLKQVMTTIQVALSEIIGESGLEPEKQLAHLCQSAFKNIPAPQKKEAFFEVADSIAAVIRAMVQLRFTLSTNAETYSALKVFKLGLPAADWKRYFSEVELQCLIEDFTQGSVQEKYTILRKLIADRKHHAATKDQRFQQGIDHLLNTAEDSSAQDVDRLMSVATLGRLASAVKRLRAPIYVSLRSALMEKLPEPSLLSEPDDRSYIGYTCEQVRPEWGIPYCARAAVYEETGEQARRAFLKALMTMQPDLNLVLNVLKEIVLSFVPSTEDPGTSTARRLKRLMIALQAALAEIMPEPGDEPGKQLAMVSRATFKGVPVSKNEEVLFEAAESLGAVIHEMVRLRFSLATEAGTYSALKEIKSIMNRHAWERCAINSKVMKQVAKDILEAMLILAKQGITDDSLASELAIASGHSKYAKQKMKTLAKIPGLSASVKNWLVGGKNEDPVLSQKQGETQQLSDDSQLADLLVDSLFFQARENVCREQILTEIEMLDPRLGEQVARLLQRGVALCDTIQTMARRKKLCVRGNPGDEEEYAPLEHEVIGESSGLRRVRIIRPVVEQVRDNGVVFVISTGVVEKIK